MLDGRGGVPQALLDDLNIEDAFAGGEEAGLGVLSEFLRRELAEIRAQLSSEHDLLRREIVLLNKIEFVGGEVA